MASGINGGITRAQHEKPRGGKSAPQSKASSPPSKRASKPTGLAVSRRYTTAGTDPLNAVVYERRSSTISNPDGSVVFKMEGAEIPANWSQLASDIVISKYFRKAGLHGSKDEGERSVRQVVYRLAHTIRTEGEKSGGYFATVADADAFEAELSFLLVNQFGAFNSPVWFNLGLYHEYGIEGQGGNWAWDSWASNVQLTTNAYERPQCSACFIQEVKDDLMAIYDLVKSEARLFKYGSGTGSNFSTIRGKQEKLSGGGNSSGLLSFLEVFDRAAGATKSGGTTRRAAKMVCLDADHPEILDFITWKMREEKKAHALIAAGYASDFNGDAYHTVSGQNSNNSVRVTDDFMRAVEMGRKWQTRARTSGEVVETLEAKEVWRQIAEAAWACADPGVQYDTTVNRWHTCPNTARINASNPCCFTGDMLVDTSEGPISFEKLEEMSRGGEPLPYAFSFDKTTNLPVLRPIRKAWVAGKAARLVRVETKRGLVFTVTPEHRFLLRGGQYVEAQFLEHGARLRKIGRWVNEHRQSRRYINHRGTPDVLNGTVLQNRFVWEQMRGPIPDGFHVHHKNENPTDDRFSNLELREGSEHISEHSAGEGNPRFLDVDNRLFVDAWEDIESKIEMDVARQTRTFERMSELRKHGVSLAKIAATLDEEGFEPERSTSWSAGSVDVALRQGHVGRKNQSVTVARWNAYIESNGLARVLPQANAKYGIQGKTWEEFASWIEEHREDTNDRVLSVAPIEMDAAVNVYDIEVSGTHNFGVTCPNAPDVHTIVVSNSEYMFLDDSACNLASVNLTKFLKDDGSFDVDGYRHACRTFLMAQEILVDVSSYPTGPIAKNSHDYRPLGLGYANLGSLLMSMGVPYDSDRGRGIAAALTAIMCGVAYKTSAEMAATKGPFDGFAKNRDAMIRVMEMHETAAHHIDPNAAGPLYSAANKDWREAVLLGKEHGYRNSQTTVLAPTGTIGLLMDCDTTGVEPDFALVKFKKLAGGGHFKIVNQTVPEALRRLGYTEREVADIVAYVSGTNSLTNAPHVNKSALRGKGLTDAELAKVEAALRGVFDLDSAFAPWILGEDAYDRLGASKEAKKLLEHLGFTRAQIDEASNEVIGWMTVEGAPHLKTEHYAVFDCANRCGKTGKRFLAPMSHINMMAAVQPFLSGAISKCLVGETLLSTAGGLVRLGSLYDGQQRQDTFREVSLPVTTRKGTETATQFYYNGVQQTIRVTLADGRLEQGTAAHRLLVAGATGLDWKPLGELQPGDWVASKLGAEMWGEDAPIAFTPSPLYGSQHKEVTFPMRMSPRLGLFLGMMAADGRITRDNYTIGLTKGDEGVLEVFASLTKELFNLEAIPFEDGRSDAKGRAIHSKAVMEFLDAVGFTKNQIPDRVLSASRETVLAYMSGVYLDGWVTQSICISQRLVGLSRDIQQVWANLGVHTYFTDNVIDGQNYPVLQVSGGYRHRAATLLKFLESHKAERAAALTNGENHDVFPFPALRAQLCEQLRATRQTQDFRGVMDPRTQNIRMTTMAEPRLRKLVDVDPEVFEYVYTPVASVSDGGLRQVFDLSVPGSHSYVANGVISHNTVNLPNDATVDDVQAIYEAGWRLGLKAVALYRDGCKASQPLSSGGDKEKKAAASAAALLTPMPQTNEPAQPQLSLNISPANTRIYGERARLPKKRHGYTQEARIGNHKMFLRTGEYDDGQLGEIFIDMHKEGAGFRSLMNCFAMAVSLGLQYGVPLGVYVDQFTFTRFEPQGPVQGHPYLKFATSIVDFIFRTLGIEYLNKHELAHIKPEVEQEGPTGLGVPRNADPSTIVMQMPAAAPVAGALGPKRPESAMDAHLDTMMGDAPVCDECGHLTVRNGACYKCLNCGHSMGCS